MGHSEKTTFIRKKNKWLSLYDLKKIWNPEWFQGNRRKKNYFEGWYFKNVSACGENAIAFIPGISLNTENPHAFVQVISGKTGDTWYFKYPADDFCYAPNTFAVKVNDSFFSAGQINVNLNENKQTIKGNLKFSNRQTYPVSLRRPGIMGWYRYMPFMECYHGVVSLDHTVEGEIQLNSQPIKFDQGKGYIEKDWGSSMPETWVWMQSNNFETPGTSFMLSIAKIPWMGSSFPGFLGFFLHNNKQIHFATYTGAKISSLERNGDQLSLCIETKDFSIHIQAEKEENILNKGALKAPAKGQMERIIHESVNATIYIAVIKKNSLPVFKGIGHNAGFEMIGNTTLLKPQT
ncbi:MAG: hypothetical protein EA394_04640 [Bacteroidia bacterium]|nr:MAG: hypothetical protein EA394_04640 [Bacteroidia bacterium]